MKTPEVRGKEETRRERKKERKKSALGD